MAVYFVATYDVSDAEAYAKYNPGSMGTIMETLMKHGGSVVAAGPAINPAGGDSDRATHVILKFDSNEAAKGWYNDPAYAPLRDLRLSATTNVHEYLVPEFEMPAG